MKHFGLFELNKHITDVLGAHLEPSFWVVAEIAEMQVNQRGHCYLTLIEKQEGQTIAKARATIWSYTYRNLSTWFHKMTGQLIQPGINILCNVSVTHHEVYGLSLNIKDIDANYTLGERALQREKIIRQLKEDGVFEMNKDLPLPLVPQKIAIISSPTAAGLGDFKHQLEHNTFGYKFYAVLYSSIMQGDEAPASITAALNKIHQTDVDFDLVVIIRGGGSSMDLECFDSYEVACHVAQFPIPVITGIGHERDETITDMVANTSLKTPTAVAEFLLYGFRSFEETMEGYYYTIAQKLKDKIEDEEMRLRLNALGVSKAFNQWRSGWLERLNHAGHVLKSGAKVSKKQNDDKLNRLKERMVLKLANRVSGEEQRLKHYSQVTSLLAPEQLFKLGFTITRVNGELIKNVGVKKGDVLITETQGKTITSIADKED